MSIETKFTALAAAYLSGDMKLDDEQEARISEDAQRLMTRPKQLIAPRCWINSDHFLDELQLEALSNDQLERFLVVAKKDLCTSYDDSHLELAHLSFVERCCIISMAVVDAVMTMQEEVYEFVGTEFGSLLTMIFSMWPSGDYYSRDLDRFFEDNPRIRKMLD